MESSIYVINTEETEYFSYLILLPKVIFQLVSIVGTVLIKFLLKDNYWIL